MFTRRQALGAALVTATAAAIPAQTASAQQPILDIHQHTDYSGRPDDVFLKHQDTMGVAKTILLPAGSQFHLEAGASGNDRVMEIAKRFPDKYVFFANEVPYFPQARQVIEKYLKLGAKGIGEQKFFVDVQSAPVYLICDIAQDYGVPILLHFQHERYNVNFDQFWRLLAKYPRVNFIGHAQTWWANIDAKHEQPVLYPKWKVAAGGWTDRYLRDYPNMYADLSAGSGLNAMQRDQEHARKFIERHQDKLLYGSDCSDHVGTGTKCSGSQQIAQIKRLAPSPAALKKIFWDNATRVCKL
jgi:predicted TIM-barrel fold metal-dependent hydrolase